MVKSTIVPIKIIPIEDGCHIMVEAKIDNKIICNLIIDTGASQTVFDKEFINDYCTEIFDNDDDKIKSSGIFSDIEECNLGYIEQFKIGRLKITNFKSVLMNLNHIQDLYSTFSDIKIHGLIGSDFFRKYKSTINYKTEKLTLFYDL